MIGVQPGVMSMLLSEQELVKMLSRGESETVEFKIKPPRPGELADGVAGHS